MIEKGDYLYCHTEMISMIKRSTEPNYPILLKKGNFYRVIKVFGTGSNPYLMVINERGRGHAFPIEEGNYSIENWFTHIGKVELLDTNKVFNEL